MQRSGVLARALSSGVLGVLLLQGCGGGNPATDGGGTTDASANNDSGTTGGDGGSPGCTGNCPRVTQLSSGYQFTLALVADGTVRAWGRNEAGQCGDGSTTGRNRPVTVQGLSSVRQVAAGGEHACALKMDGTVWCWGSGAYGRLGSGDTMNRTTPSQVVGLTGVTQVVTGYAHSCALLGDGTARCWGRGTELGTASSSSSNMPVEVSGLTNAVELAASAPETFGGSVYPFTCARLRTGLVRCWGSNDSGQLATGTTDNMPSARTPVDSLVTDAQSLVAGGAHACVLNAAGAPRCWGNDLAYQLGDGTQNNAATPVSPMGISTAQRLVLGRDTTCALAMDGTARCWGANGSGQLGRGTRSPLGENGTPTPAPTVLTGIVAMSLGEDFGCASTMDGQTRCWGANAFGQLGIGVEGDAVYQPAPVAW